MWITIYPQGKTYSQGKRRVKKGLEPFFTYAPDLSLLMFNFKRQEKNKSWTSLSAKMFS